VRKIIVCNILSLDGYFEGPEKSVMELFAYRKEIYPEDESFDAYNMELLRSADTLLLGRKTYDQFKAYWPPLANDSNAPPTERETSRIVNAIDKIVISDTLNVGGTEPWGGTTTIIGRADSYGRIEELKNRKGKDILIFGSRTLWNDLLLHDLVDELHFMIGPVLLGGGTPVFQGDMQVCPRLIDTRTWKNSGIVLARYGVHGMKRG